MTKTCLLLVLVLVCVARDSGAQDVSPGTVICVWGSSGTAGVPSCDSVAGFHLRPSVSRFSLLVTNGGQDTAGTDWVRLYGVDLDGGELSYIVYATKSDYTDGTHGPLVSYAALAARAGTTDNQHYDGILGGPGGVSDPGPIGPGGIVDSQTRKRVVTAARVSAQVFQNLARQR